MGMNQEIKAQWLTALRGDSYKQGQSRLVTLRQDGSEEFCCLGVLCDLAVKAGLELSVVDAPDEGRDEGKSVGARYYNDVAGVLPVEVVKWAGLEEYAESLRIDPDVVESNIDYQAPCELEGCGCNPDGLRRRTLASLNDEGMPFAEIADVIDQHF